MHGVVVRVDIDTSRSGEISKLLNEFTIPRARSLEGFVRGIWLRSADGTKGRSVLLFDTDEHARAAVSRLEEGPPPGAPVKLESVEVVEVVAEA